MTSKIEWTDETWNPISGCTPISDGCKNCYAKRMAQRLKGRYGYPEDDPFKPGIRHENQYKKLIIWKKPRRIFVCSMGDLFHKEVSTSLINTVMSFAMAASQHTFIFLTKRPERMAELRPWWWQDEPPPKNIWLGVTCENQETADERIPVLLQIPASVRWVSIEPMLGPVDLSRWLPDPPEEIPYRLDDDVLQWVACGGETSSGARPMQSDWARCIREQCISASVPFFFKKHGDWWCKQFNCNPKDRPNRELDGKIWNQYPI